MEPTQPSSCVAYYRVSTQQQGRSGLGLEAQKSVVHDHLDRTKRKLVAEFIEIESGKNSDRLKLAEALKLCRLTRSKLIVARLDRLARNVAFVSRLMEAGVDFEAVDFPQANRFTIHILAAVAEYEARLISERTRAGLAAAKARGVKLGSHKPGSHRFPSNGNLAGLAKGRETISAKAAARAADLAQLIEEFRAAGFLSAKAIAHQLNTRGIRPVRADRWCPSAVRVVLLRLSLGQSSAEARQAERAARQRWIAGLVPIIADVRRSGHRSLPAIGRELNARGVPSFRGKQWTEYSVRKALMFLPAVESQSIYLTQREFATRLRPTIEEIQASGKTGPYSIAHALNARGIPGINGGRWRRVQVLRLLQRLSIVPKSCLTMAEWLPSFVAVIAEVRAAGHLSTAAIASELNARGVRACRGNCWTMRRVRDTLRRMRNCKIDYTPDGVAQATALAKVRNPKRSKAAHIPKSTSFRLPQRQSPKSKSRHSQKRI